MKILLIAIALMLLISSCQENTHYAAYLPTQNRFVEYSHYELPYGRYDLRTGDTVMINNEKAVIIGHGTHH